jgi:hypothetical protein
VANHLWREEGLGDPGEVFIQWKGTDVCFDFRCECGADAHFDGYFAYAIKCPLCGTIYEMPSTVTLLKVETSDHDPVVPELDPEP